MNLFRPLLTIAIAFSMVIPLAAQYIIVDHQSVKEFDKIPDQYRIEAAAIPMLFMDRSVGPTFQVTLIVLLRIGLQPVPTAKNTITGTVFMQWIHQRSTGKGSGIGRFGGMRPGQVVAVKMSTA